MEMKRWWLLAAALVWLFGLPGDWVLDDYSLLGLQLQDIQWRPLTYLTFWLNGRLTGELPWAYRLVNILLHAASVQLCYTAIRRLLGEQRAFAVALVFAVHPLQAEAVLYVFSRPIVLMGLFAWAAIDRWLAGRHWWSVGLLALALLAKEEAIALAGFLLLLHLSISRNRAEWKPLAAMVILVLATVAATVWATAKIAGSGAGARAGIAPLDYLATQPQVFALYAMDALWPWRTGFDWQASVAPRWQVVLWLLPLGFIAWSWQWFTRARWGFWATAALVWLLPTSSIFPLMDLSAERRLYLAIAMVAAAIPWMRRDRLLGILGLLMALGAARQAIVWRDPKELWAAAMANQPELLRPALQYCRYVPAAESRDVLRRYESAGRANAGYWTELGRVELESRRPAEALRAFGKALAIDPETASHHYNRGIALAALNQNEAARADFERTLQIDPGHKLAKEALRRLIAPAP